jgi:hypothetical protein
MKRLVAKALEEGSGAQVRLPRIHFIFAVV